ncbi:MAG: hypothetical protein ABIY70_02395 [Capsulimonas sp.]
MAKARQALMRQSQALTLVHLAVSKPYCVLQIDWMHANPSEINYSQLTTVRNAERYLQAESILMAADGRREDAVKNAALGFKISRQAENGKSSIAYLVGVACNAMTLGSMRKILYLYGDRPGVALLVHDEVANNFRAPSAAAGMRTELVLNIGLVEYLRTAGWGALYYMAGEKPSLRDRIYNSAFLTGHTWDIQLNYNGVLIIRQSRQAIFVADRPFYMARPTLAALSAALNKKSKLYGLTKVMLPNFEKMVGRRAQVQDNAEIVMLASLLIDKHNRNPNYPLSTPTPIDVYSGKPLQYRLEGDGFVIYTPGFDGTFDGGTETVRPKIAGYVFHYPIPSYYSTPEQKSQGPS